MLCDLVDYSQPASSVCGFLQARILEWVAMPFSRGSSRLTDGTRVSRKGRQILYFRAPLGSPKSRLGNATCFHGCFKKKKKTPHTLVHFSLPRLCKGIHPWIDCLESFPITPTHCPLLTVSASTWTSYTQGTPPSPPTSPTWNA